MVYTDCCEMCNTSSEEKNEFFGLQICDECFSGNIINSMEKAGITFTVRRHRYHNGTEGNDFLFQIELNKKNWLYLPTVIEKNADFTKCQIDRDNFLETVKIDVPEKNDYFLNSFLRKPSVQAIVTIILNYGFVIKTDGDTLTARRISSRNIEPSINQLSRMLTAFALYAERSAE